MERNPTVSALELFPNLKIVPSSVRLMDFQGEMSKVYSANSAIHGRVVVKTAFTEEGISQAGIDEIKRNLAGYKHIPSQFRPEVLGVGENSSILIMKHVGQPIRDLFWINKHNISECETIVANFKKNLAELYKLSKKTSANEECKTYLEKLVLKGNSFLRSEFFPEELRRGFGCITKLAFEENENVGSFANMDATQGNLLIDTLQTPPSLKLIDPKLPRSTNGIENFTGISEIDMGMFLVTVELNSPSVLQHLGLETVLLSVGCTLHDDREKVKFYLDVGKVFGCILIASFPNTVERVKIYLESFGVELSDDKLKDVITERKRHIDRAIKIVNNY